MLSKRHKIDPELIKTYEIITQFNPLRETHIWGFSDGEKKKILKKCTECIETLEANPKLLRSQKTRIELYEENTNGALKSIDIIESLWFRDSTPFEIADSYLQSLPHAHNPKEKNPLYLEEMRNIAILLCKYARDFQACVDFLDLKGARIVLKKIEDFEWEDIHDNNEVKSDDLWQSVEKFDDEQFIEKKAKPQPKEDIVDIEKVLETYRLEKLNQNKGVKTVQAVISSCRLVHDLLGSNNISKITRDDVNRIIPKVKLFPKNAYLKKNAKNFDGLTAQEIIEKNKDLKLPVRKEEQSLRILGDVSSVYKWAIHHNLITYNPFEGLSPSKSKMPRNFTNDGYTQVKNAKKPFTSDDLKKIFSLPVYTEGKIGFRCKMRLNYQYWVMLISYTTGARPNEICQLSTTDIKEIKGVLCFFIQEGTEFQSLKTDNAMRVIPVPDVILKLGFKSYLDSVKDKKQLFPELTFTKKSGYYGKVEDWFTRVISKPMELSKQSKSFYSFRHSFFYDFQLRSASCSIFKQIVGHKKDSLGDDRYGGMYPNHILKEKIEEFRYDTVLDDVLPYEAMTIQN